MYNKTCDDYNYYFNLRLKHISLASLNKIVHYGIIKEIKDVINLLITVISIFAEPKYVNFILTS